MSYIPAAKMPHAAAHSDPPAPPRATGRGPWVALAGAAAVGLIAAAAWPLLRRKPAPKPASRRRAAAKPRAKPKK